MEIKGEIRNVIFRSEETGYTVLDLRCEDATFTIVGTMPPVSEGQILRVEGDFKTRSMYGRQFTAENSSRRRRCTSAHRRGWTA